MTTDQNSSLRPLASIAALALLLGPWTSIRAQQPADQGLSSSAPQPNRSQPDCSFVTTAHQASKCIGATHANGPIPKIDPEHEYTLPELIDIAESANPETRIAWAQAKRSMEASGVTRAEYLPLLTLVGTGSDNRFIFPFPKPIAPRGYVTAEEPTADAQVQLQYTLLDFGRGARLKGSKALEIAATLRMGRMHQQVAFTTATDFYRVQEVEGQLEAAKAVLQTAQTLYSNAQSQFDNGRATLPDVQNAEAGAAEAQYELADAEGAVKKAKLALTETIGVEPSDEIEVSRADNMRPDAEATSVEDLVHQAWASRPDLLAKVQDYEHAKQEVKSAHSAYLPTVKLNGSGGQTNMWPTADWGQLGPANVSTWAALAQLRWDIFNGARKHQLEAAKAEQQSAAEEQRATQDAVTRQVWDSYVEYETALEQERAAQTYLNSAQTSYDSSLDAFKYGVRSLVDVVQSERLLAQARFATVRARSRRQQSAASLSYAVGNSSATSAIAAGARP